MARMLKSNSLFKNINGNVLILLSAVVFFAIAYYISGSKVADNSPLVAKFESVLHEKEIHAKKELKELGEKIEKWNYDEVFSEKPGYYEQLFEREGLVFLVFENDSLKFWTDNTVAVENYLPKNNFKNKIAQLPNGWFSIERTTIGNKKLFALILLKRQYAYQNRYLANEFQRDFDIFDEVELVIDSLKSKNNIASVNTIASGDVYEEKGDYLFSFQFPSKKGGSLYLFVLEIGLNILGLLFSLWFLQSEIEALKNKIGKKWSLFLFAATIVVLRYWTLQIGFPGIFYETKLFSPELYGDSTYPWLGSLGDLFFNILLVFYFSFYVSNQFQILPTELLSKPKQSSAEDSLISSLTRKDWIWPFALLLSLMLLSGIVNYVFAGLISNSNIPFTLSDIFSQSKYTILALVIVGIFFFSYFLLLDRVVVAVLSLQVSRKKLLQLTASTFLIYILISHLIGNVDLIFVFWPILLFTIMIWSRARIPRYSFSVIVILLFIISFFSAHVVLKFADRKEKGNRLVFAQKLAAEQDPLAEHLFAKAEKKLANDTSLSNLLSHTHEKDKSQIRIASDKAQLFSRSLISKYFSGYWEKYEIKVSVFDTTCLPLIQGSAVDRDNLAFFENIISSEGIPTASTNFFYLTNSSGRISYLAKVPLTQFNDTATRIADLFIELDSRIVSEEIGFPELMLDQKLGITNDLLEYSYAKYRDGDLIAYRGKFPFSLNSKQFELNNINNEYPYSNIEAIDGFNHLIYMKDKNSLAIISKKEEGNVVVATTFSYLFAFFSLVLLSLLTLWFLIYDRTLHIDSFRSQIQYVLVSMVLFSLLFFGVGTVYYIKQQYERQTKQSVRDKIRSALVEGMQELGEETELKQSKSIYFSYILRRMSVIFQTDISLYDTEGNLAGSSQMKLFDEGLMSRKMSPESYYHLAIRQSIEHIQDEKIGELEYLSAYCSLRNNEGKLLGYLNIPYFSRQSELEKEISSILSAIINIYVLLFVISVILALAISEYFTKPLKLIQEKLSKIKLGKANEPIEWQSNDEIGSLVNEYNRMIEELQRSAALLAKSERETAWREMAKQVAHEIKNPLTPMKLSIQHLQRTWMNKDDDKDKKIERITATMIEQIETLSTIASEFSNFAKMPSGASEKVDIRNVLENCISLFKDGSDTEFTFDCTLDEAFVFADKEQVLRICNNLLKNALQAIPENIQGKVAVFLKKVNENLVISIKDNGVGIDEDKMSKIFTPNFTTKTGGMGLGLAMVKSIVETFNGAIWFDTSRGNGTCFYVSLPEYKV